MKQSSRIISADEYDDAARRTPHLCPLIMIGDLRSGMELLNDAAQDMSTTIEAMCGSRHGRALLENVARCLEDQVRSITAGGRRQPHIGEEGDSYRDILLKR